MSRSLAALVDPFIGTSASVNCFPGAVVPFGMIQWSPDTPSRPFGGGYEYRDASITGFSLTHLSGPGCPVFGDLPILPTVGTLGQLAAAAVGFSHEREKASPGFYEVTLASGVTTRLTVTTRAGIGEFTFPPDRRAGLLLKLTGGATKVTSTSVRIQDANEIVGSVTSGGFCGAPNSYTLFFVLRFERPVTSYRTYGDGPAGVHVTFEPTTEHLVRAKVGISYVSERNAGANIDAEIPGWDFEQTRRAARARWNDLLGRIDIHGGSERDQRILYTALYHSLLHPNVFSDTNGEYVGFDGQVHPGSPDHAHYANFSGWDIYRSQIPLIAMVAPQETSDAMQSMVDDYRQSGGLPKWTVANAESYIMVGDPAAPVIAGAYAFGARDFDTQAALAAMIRQAREPTNIRPGLDYHERLGYLPMDGTYGCCNFYGPLSTQLEYDIADHAIASYAAALGDTADSDSLAVRAQNWTNLFDPCSGFLRPKLADGRFVSDFDPVDGRGFVEGNACQYTPMVPFNMHALVNAMGGATAFRRYLDNLFTELNAERRAPHAWLGNEPCLGIPWAYHHAGAPHQTQELVRRIQRELYTDAPDGEPGNDDLGTLSAWFVWSALGCFPVTPGTADLALGSPLFPRIRVALGNGRQISIDAPDAAPDMPYVQRLEVDGQSWRRGYLPASVITRGTHLAFTLGTNPNPAWASGVDAAPPSHGTGQPTALGYLRPDYRLLVPQRQQTTVTLGARALVDPTQTVTWVVAPPPGVLVEPSEGTLTTAPGRDGSVALRVTAADTPGTDLATFHFGTRTGTRPPDVVLEIVVAPPDPRGTCQGDSGRRALPHTADLRIEAWAPTREQCIAEAVQGVVESFADTSTCAETSTRESHVTGDRDEDLLAWVLDEVIYRMETAGEIPAGVQVSAAEGGVLVGFVMTDVQSARTVGAVPKAVAPHELRLACGPTGWTCSVTLDV
jgi:predicted alpha-1,2-mannosidase